MKRNTDEPINNMIQIIEVLNNKYENEYENESKQAKHTNEIKDSPSVFRIDRNFSKSVRLFIDVENLNTPVFLRQINNLAIRCRSCTGYVTRLNGQAYSDLGPNITKKIINSSMSNASDVAMMCDIESISNQYPQDIFVIFIRDKIFITFFYF